MLHKLRGFKLHRPRDFVDWMLLVYTVATVLHLVAADWHSAALCFSVVAAFMMVRESNTESEERRRLLAEMAYAYADLKDIALKNIAQTNSADPQTAARVAQARAQNDQWKASIEANSGVPAGGRR